MNIKIFQIDAFADNVFSGNPAAVCPLDEWLGDELLQNIAEENNLSETAFFVREGNGYALRWFTPEEEVDLCGHATLASAHVLFKHLGYNKEDILFFTKSGTLKVSQSPQGYRMSFPASNIKPIVAPTMLTEALGVSPIEILTGFDYVVVLESESQVKALKPDFNKLKNLDLRGVVVSAPGDKVDFVSRCFFPSLRVNEDPVTGSAHCELAPYWAKKLNRTKLIAKQVSQRTGMIQCEVINDQVILQGNAVDYMIGQIHIKS